MSRPLSGSSARRAGDTHLAPAVYDAARGQLLQEQAGRGSRGLTARSLPTSNQIIRVAGSWPQALELVGIEQRIVGAKITGFPVSVMAEVCLDVTGALPTNGALEQFARRAGVPLKRRESSYEAVVSGVRERRKKAGLETPAKVSPKLDPRFLLNEEQIKETKRLLGERTEILLGAADAADESGGGDRSGGRTRDGAANGVGAGAVHGVGAGAVLRRRRKRWTREEVVTALRQYLKELPRGVNATTKHYGATQVGRRDWPSMAVVQRQGIWGELIAEASRKKAG
jgi:hypothetical protein